MSKFNSSSENEQILVYLILTFSIIGCLASIITIILINKMTITGYIKLILTMTWYQFLYDFTYFTNVVDIGNYPNAYLTNIGQLFGGVGSSVLSNWISFILLYVTLYKKSFDIFRNYNMILLSSIIIGIPIIIIYSCGNVPENSHPDLIYLALNDLYYYFRLLSIFLNILMVIWIVYSNYYSSSKQITKTPADSAINTLCRRILYYPIIQSFGRSGLAYYEFVYGFDFNTYGDSTRYAILLYALIIVPLVSVGYLIIFLLIEPHAYDKFLEIFLGIKPDKEGTVNNNRIIDSMDNNRNSDEDSYRDSNSIISTTRYSDSFSIFNYYDDRRSEREIFEAIDLNIDNNLQSRRSITDNIQMDRNNRIISNQVTNRESKNPIHIVINNLEIDNTINNSNNNNNNNNNNNQVNINNVDIYSM